MANRDKDLDLSDSGRYDSAAGWDPDAELEEKKRIAAEHWNTQYSEAFDIKNGRELRRSAIKPIADIFPPLWREGELAVLTGEGSVGKSLFATQLAECIARGENYFTQDKTPKRRKPGRPIYFIDLERTRAQFDEIYSARGRRYSFATRFKYAPINPHMHVSKEYEGKLWKLFRDQVGAVAARSDEHNIVVIDNIDYLSPTDGRSGVMRTLKTLKYWTQTLNCSILAVVHARTNRGGPHPLSVNDISGSPHALRFADSVFALGRTPNNPEYRYLKQLRSRSALPVYDEKNVAVFELKRMAKAGFAPVDTNSGNELQTTNNGRRTTDHDSRTTDHRSRITEHDSRTTDHHSRFTDHASRITNHDPRNHDAAFLGFEFQGTAPESLMLRDLAAEAARDDEREERRRVAHAKRINRLRQTSARTAMIEGLLDGSFSSYLLGE